MARLFWTAPRHCWSRWTEVLVVVKPDTVIGWHRADFRPYWRRRSRPRGGRPKISGEIRALIQRLAQEKPDWKNPRFTESSEALLCSCGAWRARAAQDIAFHRGPPPRQASGSSNNCARHSRKLVHISMSSSIAIQHTQSDVLARAQRFASLLLPIDLKAMPSFRGGGHPPDRSEDDFHHEHDEPRLRRIVDRRH